MKYENIITLVLGDWSHDGHGLTDRINISSNLTDKEITKAYKAGKKKLSFDFDRVAEDYEDSRLTKVRWGEFLKLGFSNPEYEKKWSEPYQPGDTYDPDDEESDLVLDSEGFARLYLFLVKLGNDKFEYEILSDKQNPTIEIGGYGLFSN